jgi:gamma-glutamylcyclotransferase
MHQVEADENRADAERILVFAYGSLMHAQEFRRDCPSGNSLGPARLPNYEICFPRYSSRRGSLVAGITPRYGAEVWGVLWHITREDLPALDRREGFRSDRLSRSNSYNRSIVQVETHDGRATAWTYIASPHQIKPGQAVNPDYLILLVEGAVAHDLPPQYVDMLKRLAFSPEL